MKINREFQSLIPKLSEEEFSGLEKSIMEEGCRDALVVWNDTLVDGHNRYKICQKHNIKFKTKEKEFKDSKEAEAWIIKNQLARRNLCAWDRSLLALKWKELYKKEAEIRMKGGKKLDPTQKFAGGETRQKLATIAGVSHETVAKVKVIKEQVTKEQEEELKDIFLEGIIEMLEKCNASDSTKKFATNLINLKQEDGKFRTN